MNMRSPSDSAVEDVNVDVTSSIVVGIESALGNTIATIGADGEEPEGEGEQGEGQKTDEQKREEKAKKYCN
jgi:hypothetical protein